MLHFYEGQIRKFLTQFIRILSNFSVETGKGKDDLHFTIRGKRVEIQDADDIASCNSRTAAEQFEINDNRTPNQVCDMLRSQGLDPVWKDWDLSILNN